ncbi:tyrosinase, partial [Zymoseptoria tritici IPO323]
MLFTTSFAAGVTLFAAAASASASSDFSSPSPPHAFAKRQAGSVDITTGATGGVQPRLEIGNLATRPDEWSLYIQAMSKWQQAGADDMDGYYGVSSIHGVPYEDANGVSKCDTCSNAMGFGTHDMIIFPTWHRVYLAHFEQKFLAIAQTVAQSYPAASRDRMVAAAGVLRLPFWDWASTSESNSTTLPTYITESQITIEGPNGQETIDNPLYKFSFTSQEVSSNYYEVFTTWLQTYRYPSTNGNSAESNNDQAAANMAAQSASLRDQVYQLLTACDDWMHFSNDQAGATAKCANSIESIHNNVHTLAGGAGANGVSGGHLTYLPLSTYDPIFWLHHANVDRIIALWQTIHADKWGASQKAPHSTWTIPTGAQLNMDYPLKPFNKDANSYWTSNDAKDWTNLGYDYPEFTTSDGSKNSITKFVNALYGRSPGTQAASGIKPPGYPTSSGFFPLISSLVGGVDNLMESFLDSSGAAYEYACNIQTPRYALNGSYYVFVFNGAPSSDNPSTWVTDDNLAGMMGVLANPEGMAGNDLIVTGSIPLTRTLRSKVTIGNLLNMAFDIILPYLTKNVEWRIVKDGQEVDVDSVEGFKASVYSSLTSQSNDIGSLPTWSDFTPQLDVTKDKKGGANEAIFGSVEQNQAGNSVSVPGYGSSPSGGDSSDSGSSSGGGSSDSGSSSGGVSSDSGSSSSAPSYDSGNSGSSTANANAPAYATKAHGSAPAYGTDIVPGTATPSPMGAPSGPATAPAEVAPTGSAPTEQACVAITTTTTVQETETIYVTASST